MFTRPCISFQVFVLFFHYILASFSDIILISLTQSMLQLKQDAICPEKTKPSLRGSWSIQCMPPSGRCERNDSPKRKCTIFHWCAIHKLFSVGSTSHIAGLANGLCKSGINFIFIQPTATFSKTLNKYFLKKYNYDRIIYIISARIFLINHSIPFMAPLNGSRNQYRQWIGVNYCIGNSDKSYWDR